MGFSSFITKDIPLAVQLKLPQWRKLKANSHKDMGDPKQ